MGTTTVFDRTQTLESFLAAAAAKQPAPGGGSVAALVGALASSMGEMVLNYSIGKKDLAAHEPKLKEVLPEFTRARAVMLELMVEDQAAFEALTSARKANDRERFAPALLACIRIPQSVAATAVAVLELCDRVADFVNPRLASDLAVCTELSMATVRCAVYNVRVNLPDVTEESERRHLDQSNARALSQATALIQRVLPKIWARQQG
jgi:formiminotetrahydrofolate cyclodeaminase